MKVMWNIALFHSGHVGCRWPLEQSTLQLCERFSGPVCQHLDGPVGHVSRHAAEPEASGFSPDVPPEPDPLHQAADQEACGGQLGTTPGRSGPPGGGGVPRRSRRPQPGTG